MRFFQHIESKPVRVVRETACIGKHVECALWFGVYREAQFFQPSDQVAAAFVIDGTHALHIGVRMPDGTDAGTLCCAWCTNEQVLLQFLQVADMFFRCNQVAQTQAGHGKTFGKAVDDKRVVREFEHGMCLAFIDEAVVNFV